MLSKHLNVSLNNIRGRRKCLIFAKKIRKKDSSQGLRKIVTKIRTFVNKQIVDIKAYGIRELLRKFIILIKILVKIPFHSTFRFHMFWSDNDIFQG